MNEPVTKFDVLKLAINFGGPESPEDIIQRAKEYWAFLNDAEPEKATPALPTEAPVAPGVKRGRKPKAVEVINDEHGPAVPAPEALAEEDKSAAPKVDYKEVQVAVLDLVRGSPDGKDKAVEILEQFGISTALDLKPEQYAEALALFKAAASEKGLA